MHCFLIFVTLKMHKQYFLFIIVFILLISCDNTREKKRAKQLAATALNDNGDTMNIFPVTDFLSGQIRILEGSPVTPLRLLIKDGKTDSVWIAREDIEKFASPFLTPVIDSMFLNKYFRGNSFLDQTVNAVTFNYGVRPEYAKEVPLKSVTVYIRPQTNKVERIYLEKESADTIEQLTWKANNWFSIRKIEAGRINEEKVKWNFDE